MNINDTKNLSFLVVNLNAVKNQRIYFFNRSAVDADM